MDSVVFRRATVFRLCVRARLMPRTREMASTPRPLSVGLGVVFASHQFHACLSDWKNLWRCTCVSNNSRPRRPGKGLMVGGQFKRLGGGRGGGVAGL